MAGKKVRIEFDLDEPFSFLLCVNDIPIGCLDNLELAATSDRSGKPTFRFGVDRFKMSCDNPSKVAEDALEVLRHADAACKDGWYDDSIELAFNEIAIN